MVKIYKFYILSSLALIIFNSCDRFEKKDDVTQKEETKQQIIKNSKLKVKNWQSINFGELKFEIPDYLIKNRSESTNNHYVYTSEADEFGISVSKEILPANYSGKTISEIITSPSDFTRSITNENKQNFSDFKLLGFGYSEIGNIESFYTKHLSSMISPNKQMIVESHFFITNNEYFNFTINYMKKYEGTIDKLKSKVNTEIIKNSQLTSNPTASGPTLKESMNWLVSKLNMYVKNYNEIPGGIIGNPEYSSYQYSDISFSGNDNNELQVSYKIKIDKRYHDQSSYSYKIKNIGNYRVNLYIPVNKISDVIFDSEKDSNGKCEFRIHTSLNDIKIYSTNPNSSKYRSSYSFVFQCDREQNLGQRLKNALIHMKEILPNKSTKSDEIF